MENQTLDEQIHEANIEAHRIESKYFELLHPEIFNIIEQRRLVKELKKAVGLIASGGRRVLDFGAGTGNITGKLLRMGYEVTSVDISKEMCEVLRNKFADFAKKGALHIVNSEIEDVNFGPEKFDLITGYAVLHHLPNYAETIRRLTFYLKRGGVMYLDHEASPFFFEKSKVKRLYEFSSFMINRFANAVYFWIVKKNKDVNEKGYTKPELADYWIYAERHVDHERIREVFEREGFEMFEREDYFVSMTRFPNPFYCLYVWLGKPNSSLCLARK